MNGRLVQTGPHVRLAPTLMPNMLTTDWSLSREGEPAFVVTSFQDHVYLVTPTQIGWAHLEQVYRAPKA